MEKSYRIEFDRNGCIGAAICCAATSKFWKFNEQDQKVDLNDSMSKNDNNLQVLDIEEKDFKENHDAAVSCPVTVIHIIDLKTGKRII